MGLLNNGAVVLDNIPVEFELSDVLKQFQLRNMNARIENAIEELITLVKSKARPKAIYKVSQVSVENRKIIIIDGVGMISYLPSISFEEGEKVFPSVTTCGTELDVIETPPGDMTIRYCLEVIKVIVLKSASDYLREHLISTHGLKQLTRIGPGEALGPIAQQKELFSVLGDVEGLIGVKLTGHNMMVPEKSTSGIFFETEVELASCVLCPDMKCQGRHAAYEPDKLAMLRP